MDQKTSRGPSQPQPFGDSVKESKLGRKHNTWVLPQKMETPLFECSKGFIQIWNVTTKWNQTEGLLPLKVLTCFLLLFVFANLFCFYHPKQCQKVTLPVKEGMKTRETLLHAAVILDMSMGTINKNSYIETAYLQHFKTHRLDFPPSFQTAFSSWAFRAPRRLSWVNSANHKVENIADVS